MPERIEEATANPGEVRNVVVPRDRRCYHLTGVGLERCQRELGHAGAHSSIVHLTDDDTGFGADEHRG